MYVKNWFHLYGLTSDVRKASENLQNGKFLLTALFEPPLFYK